MKYTTIRWACLFSAIIGHCSGNPGIGFVFSIAWLAISIYQLKNGKY